MSAKQTIVIPYTRIETLQKVLRDVTSRPENSGATLRLIRAVEADESAGCPNFAEHLYSEFKALQVLVQGYDCQLTIELQPRTVTVPAA